MDIKTAHLRSLMGKFLKWCEIDKGQREVTVKGKYNKLINLIRWLEDTGKNLSLATLEEYKDHMYQRRMARGGAVKERVLNGIRTDFKSNILPFCSWLFDKGHIKEDWKQQFDLPRAFKTPPLFLDDETIDKVIDLGTKATEFDSNWSRKKKKEYRLALRFLARTGNRIGSVYSLKMKM